MTLKIQFNDHTYTAALAKNSSVEALKELLPLTLMMHDYAHMEKGGELPVSLPQNNRPMHTQAGDIILYQGKTLVIYYDQNDWSLTPIAKIEDATRLKKELGKGSVEVTFSLQEE